jgi:hypothetical protein
MGAAVHPPLPSHRRDRRPPPANRWVPFHQRHETELRSAVADQPSLTLEALRTKLSVDCHLTTLWHALGR